MLSVVDAVNGYEEPLLVTPLALPLGLAEGVLSGVEGVNGGPSDVGVGVMLVLPPGVEIKLLAGERLGVSELPSPPGRLRYMPRVSRFAEGGTGGREIGCPPTTGPSIMLIEFRWDAPPAGTGDVGDA